jgi:hypothetical protein
MMNRKFGLLAVLLLTLFAYISSAHAQDLSSMENNATMQENASTAFSGVQGIWKATLGEQEIVMAVNQSGESLFGQAKLEGDNPWNGAIAGSLSQNAVSFSLAAMDGGALTSIYISAALEGSSMLGVFIRSDGSGKAGRGDFSAFMISPDTAGYTPAVVTAAALPVVQEEQVKNEQKNETNAAKENEEPAAALGSKSRFKDVTELAKGIDPNIMPRMAQL